METETTNQVAPDDTGLPTVQGDEGVEQIAEEQLLDDDGNPIEDEEEIDLDDLKLKVPKTAAQKLRELKEGALRQADYTRKTQELAETRRAFEAERQNVVQATNEELFAFAKIQNVQQQLAQYQGFDFAAELDRANRDYDTEKAGQIQAHYMKFQQLQGELQGAHGQLANARGQRMTIEQQETARLVEQGRAELAKEGWNDELKAKLTDFALSAGLSREDLSDLEAQPAAARILRDAYQWRQHQQTQKAVQRHETAQQVQPAATVSARRAPPSGLDDRLSADEWVKRRNEQLRKRG